MPRAVLMTDFFMAPEVLVSDLEAALAARFPGAKVEVICERMPDPPHQRVVRLLTPRKQEVTDELELRDFLHGFCAERGYDHTERVSSSYVFAEFPPTEH